MSPLTTDSGVRGSPGLPRFVEFLDAAESLLRALQDPRRALRAPDRLASTAIKFLAPHGTKGLLRDVKSIARDHHQESTEEANIAAVHRLVDGIARQIQGLYVYDQIHLRSVPLDQVLARLRKPLLKKQARTQLQGLIGVLRGLASHEIHAEPMPHRRSRTQSPFVHVYMAYCREDRAVIRKVAAFFRQQGVRYFLDEKEIVLGDSIPAKVSEGLGSYTHFLLFWSQAAVRSRFLDSEWGTAFMKEVYESKPLLPVLLDGADLPNILSHKSFLVLDAGEGLARGMAAILKAIRSR